MRDPLETFSELEGIDQAAAAWVLRLDAGLTPMEEAEFAEWLAADPRHESCLAEHQQVWERFAPLAAQASEANGLSASAYPGVIGASGREARLRLVRFAPLVLAAAAAIVLGAFVFRAREAATTPLTPAAPRAVLLPLCEQRTLEDGSEVDLNRGAAIAVDFSPTERRVRLVRGEAHFKVAKNPARPFIVSAGGVEVKAVGTAFDVLLGSGSVEVLVTEGRVQVAPPMGPVAPAPILPAPSSSRLVSAGERALVSLAPSAPAPVVTALTAAELDTRVAWQPKLLDFDDVALAAIVQEFNRCNPMRLTVVDPALGALRLTASFRSDNMDGFVRLMESNYGIQVEPRSATEIVLRRR